MVVRSRVGRRRYVAFRVADPWPSRADLARSLPSAAWKLTVYEAGIGIVRVPHTEAGDARAELARVGAVPTVTSGTLRAAKRAAGIERTH